MTYGIIKTSNSEEIDLLALNYDVYQIFSFWGHQNDASGSL